MQNIAKITAGVTNADQRPENATTRSACVTLAPLNWAAGTDRAAPVNRRNRLNRWVLVHSSIRICVALSMNIADDALHLFGTTNTAL